jgi:hypothetical protein
LKKILYIILLFISSKSFATTVGPNEQYFLVHDYHDDWQVYNDRMKAYIPYISEQHLGHPSHTVFCDIQSNRGYNILVYAQKDDNFLFINGSLRQKIPVGKWIVLNVDSLYRAYEQPVIYITLYGSNDIEDKKLMLVYKRSLNQKPIVLAESGITAKPRTPAPYRNYIVLVSMFILVFFSYLSNSYVRAFQRYFNLKDLFNTFARDQSSLINNPLNRMNVMFIILLSLIISLFYMLLQSKDINIFGGRTILQEGDTLGILLSNYFRMTLAVFVLMVIKYFFIGVVGQLFNLEKIVDLHYFKIVQASSLFYSALVLLLSILFMQYLPNDFNWQAYLFTPIVAFYLIRVFILYSTIIRGIPKQNLYLISYLCIVEILPVILGIRFAI